MTKREALIMSAIVALTIGLLVPVAWLAFAGNTSRTPAVEKSAFEQMSESERERWISENSTEGGFIEHVTTLPGFISKHWVGYLEASLGVFLVVFVLNSAYMLGRRK